MDELSRFSRKLLLSVLGNLHRPDDDPTRPPFASRPDRVRPPDRDRQAPGTNRPGSEGSGGSPGEEPRE